MITNYFRYQQKAYKWTCWKLMYTKRAA